MDKTKEGIINMIKVLKPADIEDIKDLLIGSIVVAAYGKDELTRIRVRHKDGKIYEISSEYDTYHGDVTTNLKIDEIR